MRIAGQRERERERERFDLTQKVKKTPDLSLPRLQFNPGLDVVLPRRENLLEANQKLFSAQGLISVQQLPSSSPTGEISTKIQRCLHMHILGCVNLAPAARHGIHTTY